ncbi:MAG: hypothetical protein HYX92_12310 [Chloroflexi bacterium]|nr:hypothetical protein [Chloroflexota bacterium]
MPTVSVVATGFVPTARFTAKRRGFDCLAVLEIKGEVRDQRNVEEQILAQAERIEKALASPARVMA